MRKPVPSLHASLPLTKNRGFNHVGHGRSRVTMDSWHPGNAGTEHVVFSPTRRQVLLGCTKREDIERGAC